MFCCHLAATGRMVDQCRAVCCVGADVRRRLVSMQLRYKCGSFKSGEIQMAVLRFRFFRLIVWESVPGLLYVSAGTQQPLTGWLINGELCSVWIEKESEDETCQCSSVKREVSRAVSKVCSLGERFFKSLLLSQASGSHRQHQPITQNLELFVQLGAP